MRSVVIVATILAVSLAIPAGLLMTGNLTTTQLAQPKEQNAPVVQAPIEPIKEQLPAAQEPKQSIVAEPPRQDASIKPSPQQQPVQMPQAVPPSLNIREGVPSNYVLKVSSVRIRVALGNEGANVVRANLTDAMLTAYPAVKEAFIDLNTTTQIWINTCRGADCIPPSRSLRLNEQELSDFIQLVNPPSYNEPNRFENRIVREYGSVVVYKGVRYLLLIGVLWENP